MGIDIQPDFSITIYTQDNDMCPQYSKKRRKRRKRTERIIRSKQTDVTHPGLHTPYIYRPICATAPSPTLVSTACTSLRFLSVVQRHAALLPPILSVLFYFIRVLCLLLLLLHRQRGGYRWGTC